MSAVSLNNNLFSSVGEEDHETTEVPPSPKLGPRPAPVQTEEVVMSDRSVIILAVTDNFTAAEVHELFNFTLASR